MSNGEHGAFPELVSYGFLDQLICPAGLEDSAKHTLSCNMESSEGKDQPPGWVIIIVVPQRRLRWGWLWSLPRRTLCTWWQNEDGDQGCG